MNTQHHTGEKVSVIIPAYNAAKYLAETIECVLNQTWQNIELIIVDDGSKDETAVIAAGYEKDERVKVVGQSNLGCSGAKNTGLTHATGSYIQYLDADDLLSPGKIAEQVAALSNNPMGIAVSRTLIFHDKPGDTRIEIDTDKLFTARNTKEFILNLYGLNGSRGMIQPNAFLLTRKLSDKTGRWDMSISPSPDEDGEYFCRAILAASEIVYTPGSENYYRKPPANHTSLSRQHSPVHIAGALRSLQLKQKHLLAAEDSARVRKLLAEHYSEFVYMYSGAYPELSSVAMEHMKELGYPDSAASGGRVFRMLAGIVGFKNAIHIKNTISARGK